MSIDWWASETQQIHRNRTNRVMFLPFSSCNGVTKHTCVQLQLKTLINQSRQPSNAILQTINFRLSDVISLTAFEYAPLCSVYSLMMVDIHEWHEYHIHVDTHSSIIFVGIYTEQKRDRMYMEAHIFDLAVCLYMTCINAIQYDNFEWVCNDGS